MTIWSLHQIRMLDQLEVVTAEPSAPNLLDKRQPAVSASLVHGHDTDAEQHRGLHAGQPVMLGEGGSDHSFRCLDSQVLARERTVVVEANPRTISQMANVSSNNPPGMAATSPAPATPNSSSRLPPAKHA